MAKTKVQQFLGQMYAGVDVTNEKSMLAHIGEYIDRQGKAPDIIIVNEKITVDSVKVPSKYNNVQVLPRQYCMPNITIIANWIYVDKEI